MERSNFHEDDFRHYVIKLGNFREDGGKTRCGPNKKNRAKKNTCQRLLAQAKKGEIKLSPTQIKSLEERLA